MERCCTRDMLLEDDPPAWDQGGTGSVTAEAYSDANWGTNLDGMRSVSGVMGKIGSASVVLKSKFQRTVPLSSAQAEYMALII